MPSATGPGTSPSTPRWKRKIKQYRPYSTAQDSALANRSEIPPRWMGQSQPKSQVEASVARSTSSRQQIPHGSNGKTDSTRHTASTPHTSPPSPWDRHKPTDQSLISRKRKSDKVVRQPPSRRRKVDIVNSEAKGSVIRDEAYMRRNLQLPTMKEYPRLPVGLLEAPKLTLHNSLQGVARTHSTFSQPSQSRIGCNVTFKIPQTENIQADGEGTNKRNAEKAAYLHLLAKLHEHGILKEIFGNSLELDKKTLDEERDAKLDIYNYAARYGCVPRITVQSITGPLIIEGGRKRGRKVSRTGIEVVVEMPEHNIKVSGRGRNMVTAEIAASIRFKEEAEKYHAEQGTDTLIIKDFTTLNVDNARDFFAFYKNINSGITVEVELTEQSALKSNGSSAFEGKVIVDGNEVGNSVIMSSKKKAEDLAFLSAAIELTRLDASLLPRFLKAPRSSSGEVLKSLNPVDMTVDEECILLMRDTLLNARRLGLRDEQEELGSEEEVINTRRGRYRRNLAGFAAERRSLQLEKAYAEYLQSPHLAELRKKREELPMNQCRAKVLDIVNNNTYSIVVGATGSGKTTQVPQILLEQAIQKGDGAACNIVCTQPRRIAATSVARRVADERAEKLQETVGYHVRFDAKLPVPGGSILYCTTGILLQQLQHSPDEVLDGTSHLIIDEVHERDMQIDFLLIILKKVMAQRLEAKKPTPKVVLMSATMNSELFASYFQNTNFGNKVSHCPTLSVPGRTFPVKERYLEGILETLDKEYGEANLRTMYTDIPTREYFEAEKAFSKENPTKNTPVQRLQAEEEEEEESIIDWKKKQVSTSDGEVVLFNEKEEGLVPNGLVATVIAHLAKTTTDGAILVFLPGLDEMVKVDELLRTANILGVDFRDESKYKMHMLHSSISAGQNDVFNPVPNGCRKIILGTNIAETSITIPDVRYVIDTGKLREKRYDQIRRITKLQCTWISKSNSKQRAGRAGRVQDGHYYALFSKARFESLRAIGLPELLRSDLQETCLDIKAQAFKAPIREFLAGAIEPPPPQAVHAAVLNLQALDALTDQEKLTALGRLLASLPVHPALGKMIILGVVFRCLDPMLILGAAAEERSMFLNPLHARREAQQSKESFTDGSGSDHIAMLNAFSHMRKLQQTAGPSALWEFSNKYFLHQGAFKSIDNTAKQIEDILVEARIIPHTPPHARANFQYGDPSLNQNSSKYHVIKALALAGFHPNLAVATSTRTFRTVGEKNAIVHPSSVNNTLKHKDIEGGRRFGTIFSYSTMARSNDGNNIFLRETSESTPLMATLFGGRLQNSPKNQRVLEMDDWLPFYVKSEDRRAVKTIIEFRKALERLLTGAFRDLSREQSESGDVVKRFLAEDRVRECFAEGLVEVLNRDVRMSDRTVQRGWGGGNDRGAVPSNARRGGEERRPRIGQGRWASAAQAKEHQQDKRYGSGFGWM